MVSHSSNFPNLKIVDVHKLFRLPVQKADHTTITDKLLDAKIAVEGERDPKSPGQSSVKQGLGRTEKQILANLKHYFPHMEKGTPVNGKQRRFWATEDRVTWIEIIGDPQDIGYLDLTWGIPKDAPDVIIRNVIISNIFLKNALPNWSSGADWIKSAFKRIGDSKDKTSEEIQVGNALVRLNIIKQTGMCFLIVERNK